MKDKIPSYTDKYFTLKEFLGVKCFEDIKNRKTGEIIDKYLNRDNSGLFQSSTRVSAVLFVGYDRDHNFKRKVFLNPKAKNPLREEEIKIIEGM